MCAAEVQVATGLAMALLVKAGMSREDVTQAGFMKMLP
jgi:hypothetical protein